MQIAFRLGWVSTGQIKQRSFKHQAAYELLDLYISRIRHFCDVQILGMSQKTKEKTARTGTWLCTPEKSAQMVTSDELSKKLDTIRRSALDSLQILIGGPDGFSESQLKLWTPDWKWSFGPLTLPHELAAIVAGEQIYRAWTILENLPYHASH